ncbi:MAG TPA: tRNA (guanine(10)-N(2))-dimethyltransferase, partial [Geobacterales bacterium]|nr:tRNA (guanine(10)-N(2))-dimethyltransferase [Geobacterales bacterium]
MIEEGKARIVVKEGVFYNAKAKLSRDIGVAFVYAIAKKMGRKLRICEPLAATGIRGIRYMLETDSVEHLTLNDKLKQAYINIIENVEINSIKPYSDVYNEDANLILEKHAQKNRRFDFVDIDPFGSPISFVQSGLRSLAHKGYLAIASTDTAAIYGVAKRACLRRYSSVSLKNEFMKEIGLRILTAACIRIASMNELALKPVFAHATMHYVRVYFTMQVSISKIDPILDQIGYAEYCERCLWRTTFKRIEEFSKSCKICGNKTFYAGPLWLGALYEKDIINAMLDFKNSIEASKLLETINQEAEMPAFFYTLDSLASKIGVVEPKLVEMIQKIRDNGFLASRTHLHPKGIKTNADYHEVINILKEI